MNGTTTRTHRLRAAGDVSLDELRAVYEATQDFDGTAKVSIETEAGQRDSIYYYLVVTETR